MTDPARAAVTYQEHIVNSLAPVRPLATPLRRAVMLVPAGLVLATTAPLVSGGRGDLYAYAPLLTWGATALQSLLGLWLLALGFQEAVPGRNISGRALALAGLLTTAVMAAITVATNAASPTVVPRGREWQDWIECVAWPAALGAPLMIVATMMALRAFPTRPAIAGALCGGAAGLLSDAGWRLTCWISDPRHILESHALAAVGLAAAGALLAVTVDRHRWTPRRGRGDVSGSES